MIAGVNSAKIWSYGTITGLYVKIFGPRSKSRSYHQLFPFPLDSGALASAGDLVINPVVGCRYFPPGPLLLSQPKRSPPYQIILLGDIGTQA